MSKSVKLWLVFEKNILQVRSSVLIGFLRFSIMLTVNDFQQNTELSSSHQFNFDPDNVFDGDRLSQAFQDRINDENTQRIPSGALDEDVPCTSPASTLGYNTEDESQAGELAESSFVPPKLEPPSASEILAGCLVNPLLSIPWRIHFTKA